jgi:hypothetical protein
MKITCFRRFLPRRRRRGLHSLIAHFGLAPKRLYESAFPFCRAKAARTEAFCFRAVSGANLGNIFMDIASAGPCSYSNRTDCGRTPLVASDRSSTNTPKPLGSKNGSIRICFGIDHHFSDPQRNHQPKTTTAQRSRGGEKSGDLSGFGSGRCFR